MPDRLYLAGLFLELIHAVERRRGAHRGGVVVEPVESVFGIEVAHFVGHGTPFALLLLEIPLLGIVERRRDVDVVEEVERGRDGYRVLDAVAHVFERLLGEDLRFGGGHRVGHLTRVLHRNLLVPPCLALRLAPFEGVEARDVEDDVGQRHRDRGVLRVLRHGHVHRERERGSRPVLRVGDRRVGLRLENVIDRRGRVFGVTARGEVDRCGEGGARVGLRILRVRPLQAEGVLFEEVGFALLAGADARELGVEVARVLVAFDVARCGGSLPRSERVDARREGEVHVLAEGEVVTEIAEEEAALAVLAVGRHQESRLGARTDREEALRNTEEIDRYVLHDQVGGAGDHLLARNHLRLGHGQIEVGVIRLVAGGVFAALDVDVVVGHLLHAAADEPSVALLRRHALDLGLARLEIVGDGVHLVGRGRTFGEFGSGDRGLPFQRVGLPVGVNLPGVHVDAHEVGFEVHVLVIDVALVVDVDHLVADVVDQRVGVLAVHDVFEEGSALLFAARGVALERIGRHPQRVGRQERIRLQHERIGDDGRLLGFGGLLHAAAFAPREALRPAVVVGRSAVGGGDVRRCGTLYRGVGGKAENHLREENDDERRSEIF